MVSAFQAAAAEAFPSPSAGSQSGSSEAGDPARRARSLALTDREGLTFDSGLDKPLRSGGFSRASSLARAASLARAPSGNPFTKKAPPALWRDSMSTAVSDKLLGLGFATVVDLCGDSYIPQQRLKRMKVLGEGAYAVVETAQLLPEEEDEGSATTRAPLASRSASPEGAQIVAVKRLKPDVLESEDDVMSFVKEARLLLKLRHPSIIQYIGLGCDDTSGREAQWRTLVLVQEYAACGTLKRLILEQMINPTKKLYSLQDAVRWAIQLAEGLDYLHGNNPMILHRDLKAENVLLTPGEDGRLCAKLADFGLHKLVSLPGQQQWSFCDIKEEAEQSSLDNNNIINNNITATSSHSMSGTPAGVAVDQAWQQAAASKLGLISLGSFNQASRSETFKDCKKLAHDTYKMTGRTGAFIYMAPEVLLNKTYNEKVDVFSFGVILYEMLHRTMVLSKLMNTGTIEEAEMFAYEVAAGHRLLIAKNLPEALRELLRDCKTDSPDKRPSMAEVAERLKAVQQSGELEAMEHTHGPSSQGCCTIM